eukprot:TRINITY_DN5410_c0_g2_i2.p1 TRINITY_DN5410_c0_g2~~TRINITY_DN5410_c0_g2_i2.p1  ORF type:complete len:239 (+),score=53.20 TRINITY_DN5410_c0_g2_i2:382-1098(+)
MSRTGQMKGSELCQLHQIAPPELQLEVNCILFQRSSTLNQLELIYLAKTSAEKAPKEFQGILEMIWNNESLRTKKTKTSKAFAITLPSLVHPSPPNPVVDGAKEVSPATIQPLHYFTSIGSDKFYIDLSGDLVSLLGNGQGPSFTIILCDHLPLTSTAVVYLSLPPAYSSPVLVGYLSATSPSLVLSYPFPSFGAVNCVRVGIWVRDTVEVELDKKKGSRLGGGTVEECFGLLGLDGA